MVTAHPKDGVLLWSRLRRYIFISCYESIWLLAPTTRCIQQLDAFLHQCANMTWSTKATDDCPLSILWTFYKQRVVARPFLGSALFQASFLSHYPIWFMRLVRGGLGPRFEIWTWFLPFPSGLMLFQWFHCFIQVRRWRMEVVVSWWYACWWMLSTRQWQWWCKEMPF